MNTSPPLPADRAIALIKDEHRALGRVLGAMQAWIARRREAVGEHDIELFDSMLSYVENVPDRLHHPKEDQVLFPALSRRTRAAHLLIRQLEREHLRGAQLLAVLRGAFQAHSYGTANGLNQLATAVDEFAEFYWDHMRREETQLLPLALEYLSVEDWQQVASAFGDNTDPMFGAELVDEFRQLYRCIAEMTPPDLRSYLEEAAPFQPAG